MSLFCASRIREREKDTHTQREREKRASKLSASLYRRREGTRERKPIWIGKNRLEAAQKERTRFPREKQKQRRRKDKTIKRTVFSSESSSLSFLFREKVVVRCYTRWFDDVLRARTVARKRRKRSELPCSLGFRTLNHSIRKSLVKAVGNAKEEHANTRGVRESVSLLKRA